MKKLLALLLVLSMLLGFAAIAEEAAPEHSSVVVLYTNDVHCGYADNIGYAGLSAYKKAFEKAGNTVLLADCGDAIQGDTIGTLSKGEYIIDMMNYVGYDVATIGNHEFDYGMDQFMALTEKANFPYVSANFVDKDGNPFFDAYKIIEAGGWKIAFVGVSTPETLFKSNPVNFQDAEGNFIYSFCGEGDGKGVYGAAQNAVDAARAEGADIVIAITHLGTDAASIPFTSNDLIMNTTGIDAVLDGHSHSTWEQEMVKNAAREEVILTSTGTKLENVGALTIGYDAENDVPTLSTKLHNESLFQDDETAEFIAGMAVQFEGLLNEVVAHTDVDLTTKDPATGERMVRSCETNLGDLCADAYLNMLGADIAFVNGGGVRADIAAGDITYGNIIKVHPFGNEACLILATGQQILDALELGSSGLPGELGGFLQVAGLTYEVDTSIPSTVEQDANGAFTGVAGERRVKNVLVNGEPIDPAGEYKLASHNFMLKNGGDGYAMFKDDEILKDCVMIDNQVLINYIKDYLGGVVGEDYADPYGQGRIVIK